MSNTPRKVSNFPHGISNNQQFTLFGDFPTPFPSNYAALFFLDFIKGTDYTAADWTVTATTGTTALTAGNGGWLLQTTAASQNDIQHNQLTPAPFAITAGYPAWFAMRFKSADIVDPSHIFGLEVAGGSFTPTDGVYFTKAAGASTLNLVIRGSSTSTTVAVPGTLANATFYTVGWYYDGNAIPTIYAFNTAGNTYPNAASGALKSVGGYEVTSTQTMTNLPTAALSPAFGVKADTSSARTLTIDWVMAGVGQQRN